ncbi:tetratricopeptide repeat protein, partial [Persicitalea sp.]|uniref:ABC transporter substrate-binding protein n=1 Tax=Persicitalea sp. TaxID=3100273 RepID=UPI003592EB68
MERISFYHAILTLGVVLITQGVQAQLFDRPDQKFQEGINFYKQGRYDDAIQKFADITSNSANDEYAPLAHFYYGLSANKLKKYNDGNLMLRQLFTRYPNWVQRDEAYYLMAVNFFELQDDRRAFDYLNRIGDARMGKDIQGLKQHYLKNIEDVATLKSLNSEYPNDRVVAVALVDLIQSKSSNKADLELSDRLTNQYNIDVSRPQEILPEKKEDIPEKKEVIRNPSYEKRWTKGYYNVAVLFPYRLADIRSTKRGLPNQYAYDYFAGLQIARQKLKSEGVNIHLQAYDLGNEEDKSLEMINNTHFRQTDLIVGPLYARPFELVSEFANVNGITMVNPLATDGSLLENGKLVYLAHPSILSQTQEILMLVKSKTTVPMAAIYYGNNPKDSAMAFTYQEEIKKASGNVLEIKELSGGAPQMNEQISQFASQKPNHVVFFCTDPKAGPALMSILAARNVSGVPVIATAHSFDFNRVRPTGYG